MYLQLPNVNAFTWVKVYLHYHMFTASRNIFWRAFLADNKPYKNKVKNAFINGMWPLGLRSVVYILKRVHENFSNQIMNKLIENVIQYFIIV